MGRGANGGQQLAAVAARPRGIGLLGMRRRYGANAAVDLTLRDARDAFRTRRRVEALQQQLERCRPDDPERAELLRQLQDAEQYQAFIEARAGGRIYRLPEGGREQLERRLARLNRRAARSGIDPAVIHTIASETVTRDVNGVSIAHPYEYVIIRAPESHFNEWRFAAVLDHHRDEDGTQHTLIRRVPGERTAVDLSAYHDAGPTCDHCGANRRRRDTYVVVTPDGHTMQVGSSCLREVTGHLNPQEHARLAEELLAIDEEIRKTERQARSREQGTFTPTKDSHYLLEDYLASVIAQTAADGEFITRSQDPHGGGTATYAFDRLRAIISGASSQQITDEHREQAREVLNWVRNDLAGRDDLNEFSSNLVVACSADSVSEKRAGIVAYAVAAREREREREQRLAARRAAQEAARSAGHFGRVGQRTTLKATVVAAREFDGFRDKTTVAYTLRTPEGHNLVWFTSSADLRPGETYQLRATVKEHGEYRGLPQTKLTRCTVLS